MPHFLWGLKYPYCIRSANELDPRSKMWFLGHDTKLHLMVSLQFCKSGECRVPFIAITPRSTLTQDSSTCLGLIYGSVKDIYKNNTYSIGLCVKRKQLKQQLHKNIRYQRVGIKLKVKGKAVLPFDIWFHYEVILFYPTLASWCNSLNKKGP